MTKSQLTSAKTRMKTEKGLQSLLHTKWVRKKFEWTENKAQFVLDFLNKNREQAITLTKIRVAFTQKFGRDSAPKSYLLRRFVRERCGYHWLRMTQRISKYNSSVNQQARV